MNKSKYKIYNGNSIKSALAESRIYLLLFLFAVGITTGAFINGTGSDTIKNIVSSYTNITVNGGFINNLIKSAVINEVMILCSVFFGLSLIGNPLIYIFSFIRGLGTGAFCGYMYGTYKMTGLGFSLAVIFPSLIIIIYAFIKSGDYSAEYSLNAYLKAVAGRGQYERDETKIFLIRQGIMMLITFGGCAVDALFSSLFTGLFAL